MSEKLPVIENIEHRPDSLDRNMFFEQVEKHSEDGTAIGTKMKRISQDDVLEAYGYDHKAAPESFSPINELANDSEETQDNTSENNKVDDKADEPKKDGTYALNGLHLGVNAVDVVGDTSGLNVKNKRKIGVFETPVKGKYQGPVEQGMELVPYEGPTGPGTDLVPYKKGEIEKAPENIQADPELMIRFKAFTEAYSRNTGETRNSYLGRFAQGNSRVGRLFKKIPGVNRAVEAINNRFNNELDASREDYVAARTAVAENAAEQLQAAGYSEADIKFLGALGNVEMDKIFEASVVKFRQSDAKDATRLSNWWARQGRGNSKIKKFALMAGVGLAAGAVVATGGLIGVPLGLFGAVTSGMAGGAASGGLAYRISNRLANSEVDSKGSGVTLTARQSALDLENKNNLTSMQYGNNEFTSVDESIRITEGRTTHELVGNRQRVKNAKMIGGLAGAAAGFGITKLAEVFDNKPTGSTPEGGIPQDKPTERPGGTGEGQRPGSIGDDPTGSPLEGGQVVPPEATPSPVSELLGNEFNVESGHGFIKEMKEAAGSNGVNLSDAQANQVFRAVRARMGDDLTNMGEYMQNGDLRISQAGAHSWNPGVLEAILEESQNALSAS